MYVNNAKAQFHRRAEGSGRAVGLYAARLFLLLTAGIYSLGGWAAEPLPDFSVLVDNNARAIANISTIQRVDPESMQLDGELEELLRRLSPEELPPGLNLDQRNMRPRAGVGSGFIISADGYLVTNHHVVANADEIRVTLNDRREFDAEIIGSDALSDMALLKIDASELPTVTFGDSETVRVGEWVLAIGSPYGLDFSAAAGIISAKGRAVPGNQTNYVSFIQTDVAINQGNSGGPLFNLAGEVIGINSQILSSSGGSNGISFAIPSNIALNVIEQLRETGTVNRGLLGVLIKDVDRGLAAAFGLDMPQGAFVDEVQPDSPAERAGVLNNDIIVEFDGRDIGSSSDLPFYVGQVQPGTQADMVVVRNGERQTINVTVGSLPGNEQASTSPQPAPAVSNPLGLTVSELDDDFREATGVRGVRIDEIKDGPALRADLLEGDVIQNLAGEAVPSRERFQAVVEQLPEEGFVAIRIWRDGRGTTLALELSGQ